jgi:hypothetical protein
MLRRLAALGAAAEAARRYAQKNPDKVREIAGKAAKFADHQTKGRYTGQIEAAVRKAAEVAGVSAPAPVSPIRPVSGSPSHPQQNSAPSYSPPDESSSFTPPASASPYQPADSSSSSDASSSTQDSAQDGAQDSGPDQSGPAAASGPPAASGTPAPPRPTPFKRG